MVTENVALPHSVYAKEDARQETEKRQGVER
jgi:hypothetical protein